MMKQQKTVKLIDVIQCAEYRYRSNARTFAKCYQRRHPGARYHLYRVAAGWRVDLFS